MKQLYKLFFVILVFVAPVAGVAQTNGSQQCQTIVNRTTMTVCDSISWRDSLLTNSGTYKDTLFPNGDNCDTNVFILELTVNITTYGDTTAVGCGSFTWYGDTYYETPDVYPVHIIDSGNVAGCDSVVRLHLTILPLPEVTIANTADTVCGSGVIWVSNVNSSYLYQWSDSTTNTWMNVNSSDTYYVTATDTTNNCSKLDSITIVVNRPDTVYRVESICQGDSLEFYGQYLKTQGVYIHTEACDSVITLMLIVNSLPNVTIDGESSFCKGDSVTLTASGASTYTWGNNDTNSFITVNTDSAGVFIYTVTGKDTNGCASDATKEVTVNPTYNTPITASICEGGNYIFFGETLTAACQRSHTLFSSKGCDSIITLTLTVDSLPNVTIDGESSFCQGDSVKLTASGASTYVWSNGTEVSVTTVNAAGTYSVTGTDNNGCSAKTTKSVTVDTLPVITISGEDHFCRGSSTTLTASGADTYVWNTEDTTNSITVTFGDSLYSVTGTNSNSCKGTASKMTYFYPLPTPFILGDSVICPGDTVSLIAGGGIGYVWSNNDTTNQIQVSDTGTYMVTVTNTYGCTASTSFTVKRAPSIEKKEIVIKKHKNKNKTPYMLIYPESGRGYQWFINGTLIESADKQYFYPGDYKGLGDTLKVGVRYKVFVYPINSDSCGVESDTTLQPDPKSRKMRILPNPNDGQFRLQLPDDAVSVQILNANGQVVMTRKTDGDELLEMNTGLANGIYFVKTFCQDGSFNTEKLIINR